MFKLSQDLTPNLNKRRNEGALNFLLHKRFIENSFGQLHQKLFCRLFLFTVLLSGDESWKEMVQEAVGDDEDLQKELIHLIAQYGEFQEALHWAHFYNVDKSLWPPGVRLVEENPESNR